MKCNYIYHDMYQCPGMGNIVNQCPACKPVHKEPRIKTRWEFIGFIFVTAFWLGMLFVSVMTYPYESHNKNLDEMRYFPAYPPENTK